MAQGSRLKALGNGGLRLERVGLQPRAYSLERSKRRTLKLTIAYDGTRYAGWQVQKRSRQSAAGSRQRKPSPTIQGTIEDVLQQILRERVRVIGSGRTDAGVHALAQVAHLKTHSAIPIQRLLRALNHLLPHDIAVLRIEEAGDTFHARFDAARKRYRYRLFTGPVVSPFIRPYVLHVRARLNVALMQRELAALRGRHDFKAFARLGDRKRRAGAQSKSAAQQSTTHRALTDARLRRRGDELQLELEGNGFLHTMVRSIAGTILDIGRGRLPPGTVRRMLRMKDRRLAGTTAPAKGLTLVRVDYATS